MEVGDFSTYSFIVVVLSGEFYPCVAASPYLQVLLLLNIILLQVVVAAGLFTPDNLWL